MSERAPPQLPAEDIAPRVFPSGEDAGVSLLEDTAKAFGQAFVVALAPRGPLDGAEVASRSYDLAVAFLAEAKRRGIR